MSASHSESSQRTSTSTTKIVDSYNRTTNRVFNLSDVGNTKDSGNINIGFPSETGETLKLLPYVLGFFGIFALVLFLRP